MSTPLVIIPGFLPTENDFNTLCAKVSQTRATTLLIPSPSMEADTFVERVQAWFATVEASLPEQFYLLGYSMGGRISTALAQWLVQAQPGRLRGLVLESAHPGLASDAERIARQKNDNEWAQRLRTEPLASVLVDWYSQPVFAYVSEKQRQQWVQDKSVLSGEQMAELLLSYSLALQPDFRDFLQSGVLPIHYLVGENDKKYVNFGQSLQNVNLLQVPDCGHNIHQQNPDWLIQFIAGLDA